MSFVYSNIDVCAAKCFLFMPLSNLIWIATTAYNLRDCMYLNMLPTDFKYIFKIFFGEKYY